MNRELFDLASWATGAIARGLKARSGEGIDEVLERLAQQNMTEAAFAEPKAARLPVLRYLPECIGETMLLDADLSAALAAVEEFCNWRQSESYSDEALGKGFMDNYGWCHLIGPHGFFPGDDFLLGLLMLGPDRHYTDHYHPAPELYWPLTGPSDWKRGAGGFETKQAGSTIWHAPFRMHATKTQAKPLLAVWSWTRDADTPAKLSAP